MFFFSRFLLATAAAAGRTQADRHPVHHAPELGRAHQHGYGYDFEQYYGSSRSDFVQGPSPSVNRSRLSRATVKPCQDWCAGQ